MSRTDRTADTVATLLMLGMGGIAGAACFTHVHDLAHHHGQTGWLAWAVAVSVELMSVVAALEIRRSRRVGASARGPFTVLAGGVTLSLAANVAEAQPSAWGWVTAATPAGAFLLVAKLAMRRLDSPPRVTGLEPATPEASAPVRLAMTAPEPDPDGPTPALPPATPSGGEPGTGGPAPALIDHARRLAADHHHNTGQPITPDLLRTRLGVPAPLARTLHTAITTT